MTHGVAAKLINVYLKAAFVCGGLHDDTTVRVMHPPIDRLLLLELSHCPLTSPIADWRGFLPWTRLDSERYELLIGCIREALGEDEPLWKIEEHWRGFY